MTDSEMCLGAAPGDREPWAPRVGVCPAAGAAGQGVPSSPPSRASDSTARDQIPRRQEEPELGAARATTLPACHALFPPASPTFPGGPEISRGIRLGAACGRAGSLRAACPTAVGMGGLERERGKQQRSEGTGFGQRHGC